MTTNDIKEEIAHRTNMLSILRRRKRDRELQAAKYGIDVPPYIVDELETLNQQISEHESEIFHLEERLVTSRPLIKQVRKPTKVKSKRPYYLMVAAVAAILATGLTTVVFLTMSSVIGSASTPTIKPSASTLNSASEPNDSTIEANTPTIEHNEPTLAQSEPTKTNVPPEAQQFIQSYYAILMSRDYTTAWSMVSTNFKDRYHCCSPDGNYDMHDYTSYWNTINDVEILEIIMNRLENNKVQYFAKLQFTRDDGSTVTQELYIYLLKDTSNNLWLIDDTQSIRNY